MRRGTPPNQFVGLLGAFSSNHSAAPLTQFLPRGIPKMKDSGSNHYTRSNAQKWYTLVRHEIDICLLQHIHVYVKWLVLYVLCRLNYIIKAKGRNIVWVGESMCERICGELQYIKINKKWILYNWYMNPEQVHNFETEKNKTISYRNIVKVINKTPIWFALHCGQLQSRSRVLVDQTIFLSLVRTVCWIVDHYHLDNWLSNPCIINPGRFDMLQAPVHKMQWCRFRALTLLLIAP